MDADPLRRALDRIARDRSSAGLTNDLLDARASRASLPPTALPLPEGTRITYEAMGSLGLFFVRAPGATADERIVYAHGGGFVTGGFHSHRTLVGWLSKAARATVVFPEYRLAPEHRYPAALDDVCAALDRAEQAGPDGEPTPARRLWIAGDSAGGALALGAALRRRDAGARVPDAAAILCGMLDLDDGRSPFLQNSQRSRDQVRAYVATTAQLRDPYAAPLNARLSGLPPLLLQSGGDDLCRHDAALLAELAERQGVHVRHDVWKGMFHVWHRFAPELPQALRALDEVARFLRERG